MHYNWVIACAQLSYVCIAIAITLGTYSLAMLVGTIVISYDSGYELTMFYKTKLMGSLVGSILALVAYDLLSGVVQ